VNFDLPIVALGFKEVGAKPQPLLIIYSGFDSEAGASALHRALDDKSIAVGYVLRGKQPFSGQLLHYADADNRSPLGPSPLIPASRSDR
jgi:hypothetical protein